MSALLPVIVGVPAGLGALYVLALAASRSHRERPPATEDGES